MSDVSYAYLALFSLLSRRQKLPVERVTFDGNRGSELDISILLRLRHIHAGVTIQNLQSQQNQLESKLGPKM